jgi:hypothetical protein
MLHRLSPGGPSGEGRAKPLRLDARELGSKGDCAERGAGGSRRTRDELSVSGPTPAPHELIRGITNSVVAARALHLAAVHDAAPAGATLLIIENVMGADSVDARGHIQLAPCASSKPRRLTTVPGETRVPRHYRGRVMLSLTRNNVDVDRPRVTELRAIAR